MARSIGADAVLRSDVAERLASPARDPAHRATHPRKARGGGEEAYTDAVVTPPSTTMVWPVMKLEASEPR